MSKNRALFLNFKPENCRLRGSLYKLWAKCHRFGLLSLAALLCCYGSAAVAGAQTTQLITKSSPALVTIEAKKNLFFNTSTNPNAQGSGFYISPNQLLTAWHVVQGARKVTITNSVGQESSAEVIESWPDRDLALIQVDEPGSVTWLALSDRQPVEGETVLAMGYPFGFNLFSSEGIVSSRVSNPKGESIDLFSTDAVVNPGMSGGPLIGSDGQVLGLLSRIYSSTGSFAGMTFAYPAFLIKELTGRVDQGKSN